MEEGEEEEKKGGKFFLLVETPVIHSPPQLPVTWQHESHWSLHVSMALLPSQDFPILSLLKLRPYPKKRPWEICFCGALPRWEKTRVGAYPKFSRSRSKQGLERPFPIVKTRTKIDSHCTSAPDGAVWEYNVQAGGARATSAGSQSNCRIQWKTTSWVLLSLFY